jgi:hypothetical protein
MPQATDELRGEMEKLFGDPISDSGPYTFLITERGFSDTAGHLSKPGTYWDELSEKEKLCLEFLADEWDYAWDFHRPVEQSTANNSN